LACLEDFETSGGIPEEIARLLFIAIVLIPIVDAL
jgi:hypothetical protein